MDIVKLFGQRLRELRRSRGFSQEKFAYFLEIDRSYYGHLERGKVNVTLRNLHRITSKLNISLAEFFNDLEEPD